MASPSYQTLQTQLQSARKSILFMETQHASTLKGLHKEIQNLQKKCSDLTFNLAMRGEDTSQGDQTKQSQLEADIVELTNEKLCLVHEVEKRDRQLVQIEEQVGKKEMEYINEIKVKNRKISALILELDNRSSNVAYLTAQLHQTHSKLHSLNQTKLFTPKPPSSSENRSTSRNSRRHSRSIDNEARKSLSRESQDQIPTPDNRKTNSWFEPGVMPDPTPFLNAGEAQNEPVLLPRPPSVLPPIYHPSSEPMRLRSNINISTGRQDRINVNQVKNLSLDQKMSHKSQVPET